MYFPNAVTTDEIQDVLGAMTASAKAVAEFGLMMGSASIAEPLSGLAGIATGNIDNIAKVQDALTYQPRTRAGQVAMKSIAKDVSNLANETGLNELSGYWRDKVVPALQDNLGVISGSVLAAGGLGLITAMSEFVPGSRATRAMPFPQEGAIKAFHGTPHDFDKFSMDAIGTGEGAQAYGHGLYFAEAEDVAKGYRDQLSKNIDYDGKPILRRNKQVGSTGDDDLDDSLIAEMGDIDKAVKFWEKDLQSDSEALRDYAKENIDKLESSRARVVTSVTSGGGSMYQVDIDANPDDFLDWDLPLSEQSAQTRQSVDDLMTLKGAESYSPDGMKVYLNQGVTDETLGRDVYRHFTGEKGTIDGAKDLKFSGIKGIRYKDGFSRGDTGGTSNYVVFDENIISIAKKYGITPVAAASLLSMQPDDNTQ